MLGPDVGQYRVLQDGSASPHSRRSASSQVIRQMKWQQSKAAFDKVSFTARFAPAWARQRVFVAIPTEDECSGKEWRLCSRIVSIGELMVALGEQYTARDIDLLWQSMIIATEKMQVKEHRNKKGERSRQ